jgi:PST family polysaccharide transporter
LVCTFCTVRWSPGWCFDRTAARTLWGFSRGLTGFTIINYWSRNADRVIIGKLIDVTSLGYYNRANQLATLPTSQGVSTLGRVFFPVLSRMADDVPRMARAWLMLVRLSFLVGLPMGIGLAIAADSLVVVFLGPAWQPVVPLLEVMSATIPFLLVGVNMSPVYQAVGRTDQLFRTGLITSILTIVFMLTGSYWGVLGIVLAGLIRCPITLGINAAPVLKMLRLRWRDVLAPLWRSAVPGAAMAAALVVVEAVLVAEAPPVTLSVQVAVGCLVYGSGAWFLNRALVREALRGRAG